MTRPVKEVKEVESVPPVPTVSKTGISPLRANLRSLAQIAQSMNKPSYWETRLADMEAEAARLNEEITAFRNEWNIEQAETEGVHAEYNALKESVVRYAVACGAVDVQLAMLRARPAEGRGETAMESLRRAMEEQNEASDALRTLARTLQKNDAPLR